MVHHGETLTAIEAAEVRALVERDGEREARRKLRVSPQTLARAIAQMHCQRGSLALIRSGLRHAEGARQWIRPTQMELLTALDVIHRYFAAVQSATESSDPWVDAAQAEIPQRTIRKAVRAGALEASRIGGKLLVRRSALDAFIARGRVRPSGEPSAALAKLGAKRRAA